MKDSTLKSFVFYNSMANFPYNFLIISKEIEAYLQAKRCIQKMSSTSNFETSFNAFWNITRHSKSFKSVMTHLKYHRILWTISKQLVRFLKDPRTSTFEEFCLASGDEDFSGLNEAEDWKNREEKLKGSSMWTIDGKIFRAILWD